MILSVLIILLFTTLTVVLLQYYFLPAGSPFPSVIEHDQATIYLTRFGYMDDPSAMDPLVSSSQNSSSTEEFAVPTTSASETILFRQAILDFQSFVGLNQTGVLDEETSVWMKKPRCGVEDRVRAGHSSGRKKRYVLQGSRWDVKHLTYKITKYPSGGLRRVDVDRELAKAAQAWADVTDLSITSVHSSKDQKVDIEIRFESGKHCPSNAFDGPDGTLAHAYFPEYGGDIHFDDTETWTISSYEGKNLFQIAVHEFGHSLGLRHSEVKSAAMAAFYEGYEPQFSLDNDDIAGIQQLYGKKTVTNADDLCDPNANLDAIFTMDGKTYVFKGDWYWRLAEDGIASGYPRFIRKDWPGLPGSIDAAFTSGTKTYFFKGSSYWRFTSFDLDEGYPQDIEDGFPGAPLNMDTALVWSGNGKIYFFKGQKYWRFDPSESPSIHSTYPKEIHSNWKGLPNDLDAGFQHTNGKTYFFKNGQFWLFNDATLKVDEDNPKYPRLTGKWWFGCAEDDDSDVDGSGDHHNLKIGHLKSKFGHQAASIDDQHQHHDSDFEFDDGDASEFGVNII